MPNALNERGFTLVELMITVALLAIVATVAVPNFTQFIRNNQVQAKADELKAFLQYARGQAVSSRQSYEVKSGAPWTVGPVGTVERNLEFTNAQAQARTSNDNITFFSNGTVSAASKITVCRDTDSSNGYLIEVNRSGVVKMYSRGYKNDTEKMAANNCAATQ